MEMQEIMSSPLTRVLAMAILSAMKERDEQESQRQALIHECNQKLLRIRLGERPRKGAPEPSPETSALEEELAQVKRQQATQAAEIREAVAAMGSLAKKFEDADIAASQRSQASQIESLQATMTHLAQTIEHLSRARTLGAETAGETTGEHPLAAKTRTQAAQIRELQSAVESMRAVIQGLNTGPSVERAEGPPAVEATVIPDTPAGDEAAEQFAVVSEGVGVIAAPELVVEGIEATAGTVAEDTPPDPPIAAESTEADGDDDESWGSASALELDADPETLHPLPVATDEHEVLEAVLVETESVQAELRAAFDATDRGDHRTAAKHWHAIEEHTERSWRTQHDSVTGRALSKVRISRASSMARAGDPRAFKLSSSAAAVAIEVYRSEPTQESLHALARAVNHAHGIAQRFGREEDLRELAREFCEITATHEADASPVLPQPPAPLDLLEEMTR